MAESKRPWSPPQMIVTFIVTLLVWSALGFNWFGIPGFGWTTGGTAEEMARRAVIERLVPICVAQGRKADPQHLAALHKESAWQRRDFVEKKGWATMPGGSDPEYGIAEPCAETLVQLATS